MENEFFKDTKDSFKDVGVNLTEQNLSDLEQPLSDLLYNMKHLMLKKYPQNSVKIEAAYNLVRSDMQTELNHLLFYND